MSGAAGNIVVAQATGLSQLNDCGCCQGVDVQTPVEITNRPGLAAIVYRVGTQARFRQSMLARLSSKDYPVLHALTTREDDDPAIALLDGWATIADVLTFYQERIANESYLRTATERRSVLELARLIGYTLSPGVAADAYLAFTLEDLPGSSPQTSIATGIKVQSVPGPGETAQIFETIETVEAHAEWSGIKPLMSQPQRLTDIAAFAVLSGTAAKLKVGDQMMVVSSATLPTSLLRVATISADSVAKTTRVDFKISSTPPLPKRFTKPETHGSGSMADFPDKVPLTAVVAAKIIRKKWNAADLVNLVAMQGWDLGALAAAIEASAGQEKVPAGRGVFVFRQHAAWFGYNFPENVTYPHRKPSYSEWPVDSTEATDTLFLDAGYDGILAKTYVAVEIPGQAAQPFLVSSSVVRPRNAYGQTGKTTVVTIASPPWWPGAWPPSDFGSFRTIAVSAQSEQLDLADLPIVTDVKGGFVTLDGPYLGLRIGQKIVLTGQRSDLPGVIASELLVLKEVTLEGGYTVITFEQGLANTYLRSSVTINANVALATHGQTVQEVLGSGDATRPYQAFTLQQSPLTYVHDTSPGGAASTLRLRVNDVLWHEVSTLLFSGPKDRVYVTQRSDDGKTTVEFGDGNTGARLPTGVENLQAVYRKGIGLAGLVKAGRLNQLVTRPLGLKAVTNPLDATDAADPETLDSARANAPLKVLTLDRVVSLLDYENFARTYGAIAKAQAAWAWIGFSKTVLLTAAGADGAVVSDYAIQDLITSLHEWGDPYASVQVHSYSSVSFEIEGSIYVQPDFEPDDVLTAVKGALLAAFSFDARAFTQPVARSEVIAAMQAVQGVLAVDLILFHRADKGATLEGRLPAAQAFCNSDKGKMVPAELLTIDPQCLLKLQVAK
jgi:predicted phage baseplate assembly protein